MMRKFLSILLSVMLMFCFAFAAGCGNGDDGADTEDHGDAVTEINYDTDEPVTLQYAAWNVSTEDDDTVMEREMIAQYEADHPNVTIEVLENIDYDEGYMDSLRNLAAAGDLPDIVMCSVVPDMLTEGYFADINEIAPKDPEWTDIPKSIEAATHFGDGIYMVPSALFMCGVFTNDDLFDAANVDQLQPGYSWDEMLAAIKKLTNPSKHILGINEVTYFPDWIPNYLNEGLGQFSYDGENFHLDSPDFIQAIKMCNEIRKGKYSYDSLTADEQKYYKAEGWWDVWPQGKMAMVYDWSWSIPDFEGTADTINSRFIGMPGNQNFVCPDYVGISANCEYPEVAFGFIKWMTFGKEGALNRINLRDDNDYFLESLPLSTNGEVTSAYFANAFPGMEDAYAEIDNSIIEGETWIPGWVNALYDGQTGLSITSGGNKIANATMRDLMWAAMSGDINISDYADQMNTFANGTAAKAKANLNSALGH